MNFPSKAFVSSSLFVCIFFLIKPWLAAFLPQEHHVVDFHQEWLSARNYWHNLKVYGSLSDALYTHLKKRPNPNQIWWFDRNAHPPASVLFVLPLALLDIKPAMLIWNIVCFLSLIATVYIVFKEMRFALTYHGWAFMIVLFFSSEPIYMHFVYGQMNMLISFLLIYAWCLDRHGYSIISGLSLAVAASLKLFPGYALIYFIARKRGSVILSSLVSLLGIHVFCGLVFGFGIFRDYLHTGFVSAASFRGAFTNASLPGLWIKLFYPTGYYGPQSSLLTVPWLAHALTLMSCLCISCFTYYYSALAKTREAEISAYGLILIGMLLLSPVTWEHYYVICLLPFFYLWRFEVLESRSFLRRASFLISFFILWLPTHRIFRHIHPAAFDSATASVLDTLVIHSLPCYALICLFYLMCTFRYPDWQITLRRGRDLWHAAPIS